jgi:hypothetical protein
VARENNMVSAAEGVGLDESVLRSRALAIRIARLPDPHRVAFAAGCADRALPVLEYEEFPGGPDFLATFRTAVEVLWEAVNSPATDLVATHKALAAVFPKGDHYAGYDGTVSAGAAVLRAVDAALDPTGRAAADAGLHVSSAYEQVTQWDDEPTDDMDWQEQAIGLLEKLAGEGVSRALFSGLPRPPKIGAG